MVKDAFYFSHDANARREDKCIALRGVYGWEGYGRWWALVEILREQPEYRLNITTEFAMAKIAEELGMSTTEAKDFIRVLIERFQLLRTDGEYIWSDSLNRRMMKLEETRQRRSKAGKLGAQATWGEKESNSKESNSKESDGNASETDDNATQNNGIVKKRRRKKKTENESKEEESKEVPAHDSLARAPSLQDILLFFIGLRVMNAEQEAEKFFNHYEGNGWIKGKVPIKDWKAAARSWVDKIQEFTTKTTTQHATQSLTQQRVEFDPAATIARDTAQALAELEAAHALDRNRNGT